MKEGLVVEEFAKILGRYMKKFSLEAIDIAYLANSVKKTISSVLDDTGSLKLETVEAVAKSFGLRYFEFGNPNYPMPSFESLPEKTKQRIAYRKKEGPAIETTYTTSEINDQIKKVLASYQIGDEFLANDISIRIYEKYGVKYTVTEIVNRFRNSLQEYIENTKRKVLERQGRGPKPVFYRLIKK
ncbi:hypothetical protein [Pedobacter xixiisoli]|uniref:Uncharacterized protein n=1 Tax=Pedobacter xixiisoli TaxID=1476464 RepID=A0A285ZZQ2_9SPHI|nr:hypothetical protein [Pedobacter xixiisoli]SOD15132.1 hypothetical protein SAMN06297358_2107 [Pedobacter xixiisoli]